MAEILPIGALGLIIWNKEKSTKSKSENSSDRSKISAMISVKLTGKRQRSSDDVGLFGSQEMEYYWKKLEKLSQSGPEVKEPE
ncbi:17975_t:CDS:2 [Entrophospora sp. SA101]|nr:17975_t:CDS:2 [Entrophospora sp. SA101]